jgi:hypothetical protein
MRKFITKNHKKIPIQQTLDSMVLAHRNCRVISDFESNGKVFHKYQDWRPIEYNIYQTPNKSNTAIYFNGKYYPVAPSNIAVPFWGAGDQIVYAQLDKYDKQVR